MGDGCDWLTGEKVAIFLGQILNAKGRYVLGHRE